MLRRKPTALTISPEDLAAFEDHHTRKLAYAHYRKTGEDPHGYFTKTSDQQQGDQNTQFDHAQYHQRAASGNGPVDPNDELKPLPGDKARIVRGREERIVGAQPGVGGR
jgi:hypothetical protein